MSNAKDVANALAKSELWPGANPNTILMLCYLAEAEGHHPAVVYRDYHILQGKPSKKAEAILRDFSAAGGRVEWHDLDDTVADAAFHHPSGTVRIEWTIRRAQQAGLNTAMWRKYPRQMLRSRCISEGVRSVCPAATSGLYEESEVADIVAEQTPQQEPDQGPIEQPVQQIAEKPKREKWTTPLTSKSALWRANKEIHAEIERIAQQGTLDDLDTLQTSPEYDDFIRTALEHAPFLLEGTRPDSLPPEYVQTFQLISDAKDRIVIRGNVALENA